MSAIRKFVSKNQEFEKAVELRDKEEALIEKLDKVKEEWDKQRDTSEPSITEDDIADVVSSMTGNPSFSN